MAEQYESLNETTRLIALALKYTNEDMHKAKEMVTDQYKDVTVVKGRFLVEAKGYSGMFLAFFNNDHEYISHVTSIISSKTELYDKTRVFDDWKSLYKDLTAYKQGPDMVDSQNFTYFLIDSFVAYDVFPDVREQKLDDLTNTFYEIISKSMNIDTVKCQIEFESTSSLAMELEKVPIDIPGGKHEFAGEVHEDNRVAKIEREAKYIIDGTAVVAPVKGKNISELSPGDKIKVLLPGKDAVSEKILKLLNAYDSEGRGLPVTGRIKAKVPLEKGAVIVYAFVAKGVLAKIFNEENVKVMLDQPPAEQKEKKKVVDNWIIYVMAAVMILIIICGVILFLIL